ncbi:hypothetical protein EQ875_00427 [Photobacterium damselae subsp. damselae]|uniref:hypothetical protein n=1 Tax=Photobacterium damselae TaxID=38293 RepID=UPI00109BB3AE|nr:hypothetical protein [Photobacterium damselae]TGZ36643.1 hypothetical protein EQ875_00427 [Photobacterium damselae subsp. damselae]
MNKRAIECVFGSFRNDFINIKKLECDDKYKIMLYLCLIDGISYFSEPSERQNRNRFISTLKNFSGWTDGGLISIQQLNTFIHSGVKDIDELKGLATEEMSIFIKNRLFPIDKTLALSGFTAISQVDIKSDEIIRLWNKYASDNGKLHKAYIDQFSHFSLLYELRNNLIHRFQNCSGASYGIYNEPGYQVVNIASNSEEQLVSGHRVELVYPLSFIEEITDRVLENTQSYFKSNDINVLQYIDESDVWRMQ